MVSTRLNISPKLRIKNYSFSIISCFPNYKRKKLYFFFHFVSIFVPCETSLQKKKRFTQKYDNECVCYNDAKPVKCRQTQSLFLKYILPTVFSKSFNRLFLYH